MSTIAGLPAVPRSVVTDKTLAKSIAVDRATTDGGLATERFTPLQVTLAAGANVALSGKSGGGANDLDSVPTVGLPTRYTREVIPASGAPSRFWLGPGTGVTDLTTGVVRPLDYDGSTNAVNWFEY